MLFYSIICHFIEQQNVPSAPEILTVTVFAKHIINITWSKPSISVGDIRSYIVTYTPLLDDMNSNSVTVEPTKRQKLLNVQPNVTYNISVQAVNAYGISEHSEVKQVTTQPHHGKLSFFVSE